MTVLLIASTSLIPRPFSKTVLDSTPHDQYSMVMRLSSRRQIVDYTSSPNTHDRSVHRKAYNDNRVQGKPHNKRPRRLIVDYYYNTSSPNPDDRSVLVVPRRAYYDNRTVRGEPRNMLVILTEVEDSMVNSIVACEINGNLMKKIRTTKEDTGWVRKTKPGYTHCMVIVQCIQ